jgi:hypothetical protein
MWVAASKGAVFDCINTAAVRSSHGNRVDKLLEASLLITFLTNSRCLGYVHKFCNAHAK